MLKRNISIYITDVTMVRHNVQELLAILEEAGVNYSMNIETEGVPEVESDMAEEHTWKVQTDDKGNPILPEATFTGESTTVKVMGDCDGDVVQKFTPAKGSWKPRVVQSGVPVTAPEVTDFGSIAKRIGTAEVLEDGTAIVTLSDHGVTLFREMRDLSISISAPGPAKRAN